VYAAVAAVAASILVLAVAAVTERLLYRDRVLPGVRLAGVEVSSRPLPAARAAIAAAGSRLERAPLLAAAAPARFTLRPQTVGVAVDEAGTAGAVAAAGRRGSVLGQLLGPVVRRLRPVEVDWVVRYRQPALAAVVRRWAGQVDRQAVDGSLRVQGAAVVPVEPRTGRTLDRAGAVAVVGAALGRLDDRVVELPVRTTDPAIGRAEVARAAGEAGRVLSGPVTITVKGRRLVAEPAALARALHVGRAGNRLRLGLDEARLRSAMAGDLATVERPGRDARFQVKGDKVSLVPATAGQQLDLGPVTAAIMRGERDVAGTLATREPERSTAWARSLRIHEVVSTFTTRHQPGQPRVGNIHRAADLLRGRIVVPGQQFSLNQAVGPRTAARGFVRAPVIDNGEFSEDFGGGVSQLATTTFNAVFFGGYKLVSYKAHTYYISRYPMGREATVSLPAPDLVFVNDSRAGILVHTSYTDSTITVTFFGSRDGRTVRAEGPRILATHTPDSAVETIDDPNLPAGRVIREPAFVGYDVEVFRVITQAGKQTRRERFFTRYKSAGPKIIRGTATATAGGSATARSTRVG
jgi:vancomycin resistance protein YoaR